MLPPIFPNKAFTQCKSPRFVQIPTVTPIASATPASQPALISTLTEIFLPSHSDHLSLSPDLERKKDPVHEIVLTDDEIRGIFPQ